MLCHCGQPLHYSNPDLEAKVKQLVEKHGEFLRVVVGDRAYSVQRHYIALHGIAAADLEQLGFKYEPA